MEFKFVELLALYVSYIVYLLYVCFSLNISSSNNKVLPFTVGLTICLTYICLGLVVNIFITFGNIDF